MHKYMCAVVGPFYGYDLLFSFPFDGIFAPMEKSHMNKWCFAGWGWFFFCFFLGGGGGGSPVNCIVNVLLYLYIS